MAGRFIISLDYELMWGMRDHKTVANYGDAILGGRRAIPEMLKRFKSAGVSATWATVGLLFARDRDEMIDYAPPPPRYSNPRLSPYDAIRGEIGRDENEDKLHFGRSLLDMIAATEGQEVATHTYSHFYCLEGGPDLNDFGNDLNAAVSIARDAGHTIRSIVFPRNQMTGDHIDVCVRAGVTAYRGPQRGYAYQSRSGAENNYFVRGLRYLDGVAPVYRPDTASPLPGAAGVNSPASRFLRPFPRQNNLYAKLHIRRICNEMKAAAIGQYDYHLWWHPHNMGRQTDQNLAGLDQILNQYRRLRDQYGMTSATMAEIAHQDDDFADNAGDTAN